MEPKTRSLVSQIAFIDHIPVGSEVEALLLESRLIKKFRPYYNIASKDDKSPYYIHLTSEIWPRPVINHISLSCIAGPFLNRYIPARILKYFRHIAPYCLSPRPVRKTCLYSHLGLCKPCPGSFNPSQIEYHKNILRLRRLLTGQFSRVRSQLIKKMTFYSRRQDYEQAQLLKNQLAYLDQLLTRPVSPDDYLVNPNLISDRQHQSLVSLMSSLSTLHLPAGRHGLVLSPGFRIEMYDIAHLSGTAASGAMTVAIDGQVSPFHYRHFKIKYSQTDSDVDMLAEVLSRRLKRTDWPKPDLIVLDGGVPQLHALRSLGEVRSIPYISLAKQNETIIVPVNDTYQEINLPKSHPGLLLLMQLRDEAHRFSRRLHHKMRKRVLLS